jgi:transcriptional regulator with XRE-family HTH domain
MGRVLGQYARTTQELATGMRALRKVGLRGLETEQGCGDPPYEIVLSRSTLSRYESGRVLPPLEYGPHLDRLYRASGWIDMSIRTLWQAEWDPWHSPSQWPERNFYFSWPASYSGDVWIEVAPIPAEVGMATNLVLNWGPWERRVDIVLPAAGAVLQTGKAADADGISRTLNLQGDRPFYALSGAGTKGSPRGGCTLDIREGWRLTRPE